ncbi:alpha/beta fold hydrolase [Haliangium ochraceum]|uniref:Alpha/beta hydrolase fold protein n=1 Tax=Haliangium ochraceum (strain DSM 14365 / JCM 11303 / SMP-2) TaxID=502025 RepID=D0LUG2_HALO1|nr:alpha/beta fold hydrolase [Haliangium ochraceum]ACY19285.1 alpha/beta hydrolase fold protein [Haliangium ochraceum DSM 14365]
MERLPAPAMPDWLEAMLPIDIVRYRVHLGDQRMHVMECGSGAPVLLLHGNPTWGFLYRQVAEALRGLPLRLIMPDLVGLGFSSKPRDPAVHQLENHGRWLGHLIDTLELERFVFVGQDWGGPIGLRALADRPERVAGLVLLNTVVAPPRANFKPTLFHRISQTPIISDALFRLGGWPQNMLAMAQGDKKSIRGQVRRAYTYPLRRVRDRAAPLALARMVPDSHQHPSIPALRRCQEFVEQYRGPAALVWGDRDPILGRARRRVAEFLPQAEVTRTEAGHFLQEEVADQIASAIRSVAGPL